MKEKLWSWQVAREGRGESTALYKPYRYVPPHQVGFLPRFGLKTGIHFAHFGLELGMVFEGTTGVYERILRWRNKTESQNSKQNHKTLKLNTKTQNRIAKFKTEPQNSKQNHKTKNRITKTWNRIVKPKTKSQNSKQNRKIHNRITKFKAESQNPTQKHKTQNRNTKLKTETQNSKQNHKVKKAHKWQNIDAPSSPAIPRSQLNRRRREEPEERKNKVWWWEGTYWQFSLHLASTSTSFTTFIAFIEPTLI